MPRNYALARRARQATAEVEPAATKLDTSNAPAAPPEVGLATATTGRLPMRRQIYGIVGTGALTAQGDPLRLRPAEGRYYGADATLSRDDIPHIKNESCQSAASLSLL